jgi:hypothetical protein
MFILFKNYTDGFAYSNDNFVGVFDKLGDAEEAILKISEKFPKIDIDSLWILPTELNSIAWGIFDE